MINATVVLEVFRKGLLMFITRLISGIILVALALVFIITGGNVLLSVMLILSLTITNYSLNSTMTDFI